MKIGAEIRPKKVMTYRKNIERVVEKKIFNA